MIGLISVAEATVAPIPKGIFCMPVSGPNGFPDLILNNANIVGLDIGRLARLEVMAMKKQSASRSAFFDLHAFYFRNFTPEIPANINKTRPSTP
jgi:hypothetical protein